MGPRMTSDGVLRLLASRHSGDVFVSECKDGPTWNNNHLRLDAWAMNRSWQNLKMTGYEIKVSRSDFFQDDKWRGYLPLCHELYFAAPKGVIQINELPAEAGLMEVAGTGTRMMIRKKAPYRDIELPAQLMVYLLMCRTRICKDFGAIEASASWRAWLEDKQENKRLGYEVSRKIRERAIKLETENARLIQQNRNFDNIKQIVEKMGMRVDNAHEWTFKSRIKELEQVIPKEVEDAMQWLKRNLDSAIQTIKAYKQPGVNPGTNQE